MVGIEVHAQLSREAKNPVNWSSSLGHFVLFLALHIAIGLILRLFPSLSTIHGLLVLAIGILVSLKSTKVERVANIAAYIVGAEVLWRLSDARLPWEYGKYALLLVCTLAILRNRSAKLPVALVLYMIFLLPAVLPVISTLGLATAREEISFNLSGPLALAAAGCFFAQIQLTRQQLAGLLMSLIAPIISLATILSIAVFTSNIRWVSSSNFAASGGFGPNQVSTVLGLGIVAVVIILIYRRDRTATRIVLVGLGLWFLAQGLLTFSRGGVLAAVGSTAVAVMYALLIADRRPRSIVLVVACVSVALYVMVPLLDAFTGGALGNRYNEPDVTNRDVLAVADIEVFLANPVTGAGIGLSKSHRREVLGVTSATHTEFTRALAEHGLMGVIAYVGLGLGLLRQVLRMPRSFRAVALAMIIWGFATLMHSAMRIAAPSFALGIVFATFVGDE